MSFFPNLFGHHDATNNASEQKQTATQLRSRVDSVFDDFLQSWPGFNGWPDLKNKGASNQFLAPAIDVSENEEMIEIQAELPAVDKDNPIILS